MTYQRKWPIVLLATTISSFTTPFMGSSVNVALPAIGRDFSMDALSLSWVASSFLLAAAIMLVPLGRLADLFGRRIFFLSGSLIFSLSSLLSIWPETESLFIALRVVQGIGAAMVFSTGTALLVSAYPAGERGKMLGINIAAVYTGLTAGPFIGGLLTQHLGWQAIFIVNAALGLAAAVLAVRLEKEALPAAAGESFDLGGSFLYATALFALMYGFSRLPSLSGAVLIAGGGVCFMVFIRGQLKKRSGLINLHLFMGNRVFAFSNLAALIHYCATFAITFLLSLYLQHVKGLSPSQAGFVLVIEPLLQAVFSPLAGRLSDRYEPRIISSIGMSITVVGLAGLIFIASDTPLYGIVCCLALLGIGFALFSSPNVNAVMSSVEDRFYGLASATQATMRMVGQMLSMGIAMLVFAWIIGNHGIDHENGALLMVSAKSIFAILAAICTAGVFASLARGRIHKA
ncbi:MAG TPA: MFS transporter [Smithellaceae bacterium]|jgi:EmrB/QacA subfamily drug resistance transporter|nr:MFS transporter [Syntrophaceae bacterium]NMC91328.1 MFS transporter [Smithella sp.]HOU55812.1 MFS transporter [Smithellaceae bacterium]MBP9532003.1 MFS transporter [Syntrophaceae bacterium]MBP9650508.1 MFS transporter [Syntrophaceae bacterium]